MFRRPDSQEEDDWVSVSDLMSGLMMIFLFVAISFMSNLQARAAGVKKMVVAYQEVQEGLYQDLYEEFKDDLDDWKAEIDRETLAIRFREPEVLFTVGKADVQPRFQAILREFFPRYLKIMMAAEYRDEIEEIRIEGHTSSEWIAGEDPENAYFWNMALSQDRTRAVLQECLSLLSASDSREWARRVITANGLSSSRPVLTNGEEDAARSRRVEFRTKTAAEKKVVEILREMER